MGIGGRCGMGSPDSYLSSVLSTLVFVPSEHAWSNPLAPWSFRSNFRTYDPVSIPCADS